MQETKGYIPPECLVQNAQRLVSINSRFHPSKVGIDWCMSREKRLFERTLAMASAPFVMSLLGIASLVIWKQPLIRLQKAHPGMITYVTKIRSMVIGAEALEPNSEIYPYNAFINYLKRGVKYGVFSMYGIFGRGDLDLFNHLSLDVMWLKNASLFVDLAILVRTVPAVLSRRGAY